MEELHSTEALDREILEDARKKAFKILKSADESAASSKLSWERKLSKTLDDARKNCGIRAEQGRREIMARLPMDKRRIRAGKIETLLNGVMKDFLASLDRQKILLILERELVQRMGEWEIQNSAAPSHPKDGSHPVLRYRGLSADELKRLLQKVFPADLPEAGEDMLYNIPGSLPAVMIDFPRVRIIASVDAAASQLLLDKRAELAAALLGDSILENEGSA